MRAIMKRRRLGVPEGAQRSAMDRRIPLFADESVGNVPQAMGCSNANIQTVSAWIIACREMVPRERFPSCAI
jgi:hypothetical protein